MSNLRNNARFTVSIAESRAPRVRWCAQAKAITNSHWNNQAHTQSCTPFYTYQSHDDEGVISVIKATKTERTTVRLLGAGHFFTPVAATGGHHIQLGRCSGLVEPDVANQTAMLCVGTHLHGTPDVLRPLDWALPNQGDADPQSLADAISTGTYSVGLGFTDFVGTVKGLKIVIADGVVRHCHPDAEGINGELYRLGWLGLDASDALMGVTTSVVPVSDLHADGHREELDSLRKSSAECCKEADRLESFWLPGQCETLAKHDTRTEPQRYHRPSRNSLKQRLGSACIYLNDEAVNNMGFLAYCEIAKAVPVTVDTINRVAASTVSECHYSNKAYKVLVSPRRIHSFEAEYSVPFEVASGAPEEIRDATARKRVRVSSSIKVCSVKADDVTLSIAYGRDNAYIAIHRYWKKDYREYSNLIESTFKAHEGRPYQDELRTLGAEDFTEHYPLFGGVQTLREKVDPQGAFLNEHLRDLSR